MEFFVALNINSMFFCCSKLNNMDFFVALKPQISLCCCTEPLGTFWIPCTYMYLWQKENLARRYIFHGKGFNYATFLVV